MKNKNKDISAKVKKVSGRTPSRWGQQAQFLLDNQKWLDYSARIALRIDARIEDHPELTQAALAKALNMSKQQVSRILRGDQNLTLKTIAKLSEVIGFELISFPSYKDSYLQMGSYIPSSRSAIVIPIIQLPEAKRSYTVNQSIANG